MGDITYYRTRLRAKGQVTVPGEIRNILEAQEGDELIFLVDENNRVIVEHAQLIPPDQAWFWSERWQRMERDVQEDIERGRLQRFETTENALDFLKKSAGESDATHTVD